MFVLFGEKTSPFSVCLLPSPCDELCRKIRRDFLQGEIFRVRFFLDFFQEDLEEIGRKLLC